MRMNSLLITANFWIQIIEQRRAGCTQWEEKSVDNSPIPEISLDQSEDWRYGRGNQNMLAKLMKLRFGSSNRRQSVILPVLLSLLFLQTAEGDFWLTNSAMQSGRYLHTSTLLSNGKILIVGGYTNYDLGFQATASVEIYDPATGTWANTSPLELPRGHHTATMLPNGKVLVVGRGNINSPLILPTATIFDPISETWTNTGPMNFPRSGHTATLLPNGKVLVAGGAFAFTSAELYNPTNGTWTITGDLNTQHQSHTTTLLADGQVLLVGGADGSGFSISAVEMYNPSTGVWTATNSLQISRSGHTATLLPNGQVLVVGGAGTNLTTKEVELFDPATGGWTITNAMNFTHGRHTATLLPNGKLLVVGGSGISSIAECFDPATGTWAPAGALASSTNRSGHTATLLAHGRVLIAGGLGSSWADWLSSTEIYDPSQPVWKNTDDMISARVAHTATMLPDGKVAISGGYQGGATVSSTECYDPIARSWITNAPLIISRTYHTTTLLPDGRLITTGGSDFSRWLREVELFNPLTKLWSTTSGMKYSRSAHTATLLRDGKLLVVGGFGDASTGAITTETYDPNSQTWTDGGQMTTARYMHRATLLPDGQVLVTGGRGFGIPYAYSSAELYEPATHKWTATASMISEHAWHTATLLPSGLMLVAGGFDINGHAQNRAELYNFKSHVWKAARAMLIPRVAHTATLLPDGRVLVAGGTTNDGTIGALNAVELYDPASDSWFEAGNMATARKFHTATLTLSGQVLLDGGTDNNGNTLAAAEYFDVNDGIVTNGRPEITSLPESLTLGESLTISGANFRGISSASGGNTRDSSTDYPLLQLRSIESGQTVFLESTHWTTNSCTSLPIWNFPPGWAMVTVFVNGIPSTSKILEISVPVPTTPTIFDARRLADGTFQFSFTNSVGAAFGALASTNISLPLSNWTALGGVTEISPGQFQFTDPQATNSPHRFYSIQAY